MDSDHLIDMVWISPVLLSSCIQSKNEDVRNSVQMLVKLTSPASAKSNQELTHEAAGKSQLDAAGTAVLSDSAETRGKVTEADHPIGDVPDNTADAEAQA
jgi:hypothetical protein